ncbi:MarR family transcriptional regulator [Saccharibacillus sp. CPCC 101409]|nr:MarR family transcriptional regulator [Saccharibacillus sp. CPCC 101409]MDO3411541.1 MarR family transcriptional regulator [Saccharibacillus sp. CPCC 101409]
MKASADHRLKELGLNAQQGQMIGYIYEHQERGVIQADLARRFSRTGASITSMLQGLEKNGYVRRRVQEDNERQKKVYITDKAEPLISEFNEIFKEAENRVTEGMTAEEAQTLQRLLQKVVSNI